MTVPALPIPLRDWRDRAEARHPHAAGAIRQAVEGLWEVEVALARAQRTAADAGHDAEWARRNASELSLIAAERRRALLLVGQCVDDQLLGDYTAVGMGVER